MILPIVALVFALLSIAFQAFCAKYPTPDDAPHWVRRLLRIQ